MKTYEERVQSVFSKIAKKKKQRRQLRLAVSVGIAAVLALVLFFPHQNTPRSVTAYRNSPYYDLIQKLNEKTFVPTGYRNNFEMITAQLADRKGEGSNTGDLAGPQESPMPDKNQTYEEVTDNQVAGVTEADIFKRSDRYLYYIRNSMLLVYSIEGENSRQVGSFELDATDEEIWFYSYALEMYLSQDCSTVTVIAPCAFREEKKDMTCVRTLDVTDPANIRETKRIYVSGSLFSSRMVDGKLLLMTRFFVGRNPDFSNEEDYLPQIGTRGQMVSLAAENIHAPQELSSARYTVVSLLEDKTLEVCDSAAFLSYSDTVYVSRENIFATRTYTETLELDSGRILEKTMTEVSGLDYGDGQLTFGGSVQLSGRIKDQYSMDEYKGVLRLVTSTREFYSNPEGAGVLKENVDLTCVSLENWKIVASVKAFAPEGEDAQSVRFDGDTAYVCTAEVITLTDPVYYFDLSDLDNITWKDTGTIQGYSTSLVQLGDGFLLGIGMNDMRDLKVEVYQETDGGVKALCSYEAAGIYTLEYKAYFIDRDRDWVGFAMEVYGEQGYEMRYILLHFDGEQLVEIVNVPMNGYAHTTRATVIDNWLYILGNHLYVTEVA